MKKQKLFWLKNSLEIKSIEIKNLILQIVTMNLNSFFLRLSTVS